MLLVFSIYIVRNMLQDNCSSLDVNILPKTKMFNNIIGKTICVYIFVLYDNHTNTYLFLFVFEYLIYFRFSEIYLIKFLRFCITFIELKLQSCLQDINLHIIILLFHRWFMLFILNKYRFGTIIIVIFISIGPFLEKIILKTLCLHTFCD